jgi:hypothetical protein
MGVSVDLELLSAAACIHDDLLSLRFGQLDTPFLRQEQPGVFLGSHADSLRFIVRVGEKALALFGNALRLPDLIRDGNAHLIDDVQEGLLVHQLLLRQWQVRAFVEEFLQSVNQR